MAAFEGTMTATPWSVAGTQESVKPWVVREVKLAPKKMEYREFVKKFESRYLNHPTVRPLVTLYNSLSNPTRPKNSEWNAQNSLSSSSEPYPFRRKYGYPEDIRIMREVFSTFLDPEYYPRLKDKKTGKDENFSLLRLYSSLVYSDVQAIESHGKEFITYDEKTNSMHVNMGEDLSIMIGNLDEVEADGRKVCEPGSIGMVYYQAGYPLNIAAFNEASGKISLYAPNEVGGPVELVDSWESDSTRKGKEKLHKMKSEYI